MYAMFCKMMTNPPLAVIDPH